MILTQYVEFRAVDTSAAKSHFQKVMLSVHGQNSTGSKLVVDWPKWASSANYFGNIMRVFGGEAELLAVKRELEAVVARINTSKYPKQALHISGIHQVPAGARITWMFKRHRQPCRNKSASYVARLQRRAIARGEQPKSYTAEAVETHTLMMVSLTSNVKFPMDIQRVRPTHLDVEMAEPNAYGLGVPIPRF